MKNINRNKLKNITGGLPADGGSGSGPVLQCVTPNGVEFWRRTVCPGSPNAACRAIYPAYGNNVTGICVEWANGGPL